MSEKMGGKPKIEPAKSGRASCRFCNKKIVKQELRIGIPYPFTTPDGKTVTSYGYYHVDCSPPDKIDSILEVLSTLTSLDSEIKDQIKEKLENLLKDLESSQIEEIKVIDLSPSSRNIQLTFGVIEKGDGRTVVVRKEERTVADIKIGDETGTINLTLWDEAINQVREGKTYKIKNGYINVFQGRMRLELGNWGSLEDTDEVIKLDSIKLDIDRSQFMTIPFIEPSKSSRGACRICEKKIEKGNFRVAEQSEIELEDGRKFSSHKFFHVHCYLESSSEAQAVFDDLVRTSQDRKSLSQIEVKKLTDEFQVYLSADETAAAVLALITEEPIKIESLKEIAKKKGVPFHIVKQALENGLMNGIYFEPSPGLIQKL
ncbi:MAG: hypothetical protein JSV04_03325 [Candidatus Heimdallarchaeota archaeon]|nr:MAG: hypothetical protein JSV04_03325 [Candidatus Heimdallarchaeota archaeon]